MSVDDFRIQQLKDLEEYEKAERRRTPTAEDERRRQARERIIAEAKEQSTRAKEAAQSLANNSRPSGDVKSDPRLAMIKCTRCEGCGTIPLDAYDCIQCPICLGRKEVSVVLAQELNGTKALADLQRRVEYLEGMTTRMGAVQGAMLALLQTDRVIDSDRFFHLLRQLSEPPATGTMPQQQGNQGE